jgi:uncharacterized protein (DUF1810 family)
MDDPFNLDRFIHAQDGDYARALAEIRSGRKSSHWMWYVFPQLAGLGRSSISRLYAITGRDEAAAYLQHPVLGPRLHEIAKAVMAVDGRSAHDILGSPDDLKLHSSATLFAAVSPEGSVFHQLIARYFGGRRDEATLRLLDGGDSST